MASFWKGIKKDNNTRVPLAPMVDNCIGDKEICDMWQTHYKQLLNPIRSGGGALKAPPPIFCSHAFNFGAALLCVGDFSQKIV